LVVPIRYDLYGHEVVIRVPAGSRLDAAVRAAVVAFEADDIERVDQSGWSVSMVGLATPIDGPPVADPSCRRWCEGDAGYAISTELMTGRRHRHGDGWGEIGGDKGSMPSW
jgi:hypothetical protein